MPSATQYASWGILIIFLVVFYFILIAPQKKQQKKDKAMRDALKTGDRICTIGGIIGKVISVTDDSITIETSNEHTRLKLNKWAVRNVITEDDKPVEHDKKSDEK